MRINQLKHKLQTHTSETGFKVINVNIDGYPIATSSVWLDAGSSRDPLDKLGLAHFFEHLFFTRTKKYPDKQKRLEEVEKHGIIFNAFTALEHQHYFYIHPPQQSTNTLNFIIDGLANTIFDTGDVKREKQIILSEEKQNHNDPASYIWRLANRGIWGDKLLGKDLYGTEKTINSISLADLKNFYFQSCGSGNIQFVFINSDLPIKEQNQMIDKIKIHPGPKRRTDLTPPETVKNKIVFEKISTGHCQLALTFLTKQVLNIKEKALQDFMVDYLASGWISRLIQRMRISENLTYWVYSDSANLSKSGYIRFNLLTDPKNISRILNIFCEEANKLKHENVSNEILEMYKAKFISDVLRNSTEYGWLIHWYGFTSLINGKPFELDRYLTEVNRITPDDLRNFAQTFMTDRRFSVAYIAGGKISFSLPTFR